MTQEKLSAVSGVSCGMIASIESGHKQTLLLGATYEEAMANFLQNTWEQYIPTEPEKILNQVGIVAAARPAHRQGVYFLLLNGEVIYIGRSENVFERISGHIYKRIIDFDQYHIIEAAGFEQERLEQIYIAKFAQKHNLYCGGASPSNSGKAASIVQRQLLPTE